MARLTKIRDTRQRKSDIQQITPFDADLIFATDFRGRHAEELWDKVRTAVITNPVGVKKTNPFSPLSWRMKCSCREDRDFLETERSGYADTASLQKGVEELLADPNFREAQIGHGEHSLWKVYLRKIRAINRIGGPRVKVVWWRSLALLGRLPRYPDDRDHILDLERLVEHWQENAVNERYEDHYLTVRFISHRWSQPHYCAKCTTGFCPDAAKSNPDTEDCVKAHVLSQWGRDLYRATDELPYRPYRPEDLYFWIDYAGIHQADQLMKLAGIMMLPLYVASCPNGVVCFVNDDGIIANRAWTALERAVGYQLTASPVMMKIDRGYLDAKPKFSKKDLVLLEAGWWQLDPETDEFSMLIRHPRDGALTVPEDLPILERICELVGKFRPVDYFDVKDELCLGVTYVWVEDVSFAPRLAVMASSHGLDSWREKPLSILEGVFGHESSQKAFDCFKCCRRKPHVIDTE
eukprot:CAMPEP_0197712030 /NCGR_PEP_ID=MMETSP1338-20131121/129752_1 /TAXON_ID=43686 ORGANISM="Pelagodinium beii, Strain RCC1491" /NCGR_SAMPLE_ID=MMETSP1338 /ASSEMBLY_ACC=CAM_ASM_000754 /LENGTH=464 /DNA_ID=CAMNT_0043295965 /DNA_START=213 /DNA_END=1607 /DNA_ORIENTATION=-